jgi:hypothetical protein
MWPRRRTPNLPLLDRNEVPLLLREGRLKEDVFDARDMLG